ncbi:hypothetical protein GGR54DRAFT_594154 [Hypoxylon sp. NC1633]|nr:hypothetical protein GGR54DRAFT_594154 [Hypoxylon sp. NC1633]
MSSIIEDPAPDAAPDESATPIGLVSSKRPRDYGEQLKGISASDDEGEQPDTTLPTFKKQKTAHPKGRSDSDLDDGEIVESNLSADPSKPAHKQFIPQPVTASSDELVPGAATHGPSEDGEIDSDAVDPEEPKEPDEPFFIDKTGSKPAQQHSGWNQGLTLGARTSFGKSSAQLFPAKTPTESIHEGFPKPKRDPKPKEDRKPKDDGDVGENPEDSKRGPVRTFPANKTTWNYPQFQMAVDGKIPSQSVWLKTIIQDWTVALLQANPDIADRLTAKVVRAGIISHVSGKKGFFQDNKESKVKESKIQSVRSKAISVVNQSYLGDTVSQAMTRYRAINGLPEVTPEEASKKAPRKAREKAPKRAKKKGRKQVPEQMPEGESKGAPEEIPEDSSEYVPEYVPEHVPEIVPEKVSEEAIREDELAQQRKYFPGAEDPSQYCLSCSGVGHRAPECPHLRCQSCGSQKHSLFGCPTKQRCSKCGQLGHGSMDCEEKLALASEERGGCAFCSGEHDEFECTEIWRSFKLTAEVHKKVKDIPAFCYTCGAEGHYGPECGLSGRHKKVTGFTTWSQENRLRYIDPNSEDIAIAWVGVNPIPPESENFHIRGRASKRVHTHFVSSDESEEDLVHAPIDKSQARGDIRISSNIGSVSQSHNTRYSLRSNYQSQGRQNGRDERELAPSPPPFTPPFTSLPPHTRTRTKGKSWQPPLPPGPPPPPPPLVGGFQGSLPPAPPGSLPPRPQTFGHEHNRDGQGNRGGRGGRGSYRGGGRGGGHGRGRGREN